MAHECIQLHGIVALEKESLISDVGTYQDDFPEK